MKMYHGCRDAEGEVEVYWVDDEGRGWFLKPRFDLANHSPSGFEWGYTGSGPAQLALAILAEHFQAGDAKSEGGTRALLLYQRFKERTVARWRECKWSLSADEIAATVRDIEAEHGLPPSQVRDGKR